MKAKFPCPAAALGIILIGIAPHACRAADEAPQQHNSPAQNRDIQKKFETLAGETSYLDMDDAFFGRTGYSPNLSGKDWDRYTAFMPHFIAVHARKDELIPLLKHKDPKVRTLAIAALASLDDPTVLPYIADLLGDDAVTFWKDGPDGPGSSAPPIRKDVAVGEDAWQILSLYLSEAGYGRYDDKRENIRKEFDDYWSTHKGRAYCASWFAVRLDKPLLYLGPVEYDKAMRRIRADLDKVPLPERFWIALWLENKPKQKLGPEWWNHELPRPLYSKEELLDMGRKIGPEALMGVLKAQQYPGDDPDLLHGNSYNTKFIGTAVFVLQNATALLRPQDSDVLLTLNTGKNTSPAWLIAAARLQPAKAAQILQPAFAQFPDDYGAATLSTALWELCGESQTSFIVDRFYEDASRKFSGSAYFFVRGISAIEKPPGRKLFAAILQDKRLDGIDLDQGTLWNFANAVNGWAKKKVVSDAEIVEAAKPAGRSSRPNPDNLPLRRALLDRLRDSVPEWNN